MLTSGWCPFAVDLLSMIQEKVESLPGVECVERGSLGEILGSGAALGARSREVELEPPMPFDPNVTNLDGLLAAAKARARRMPASSWIPGTS